MKQLFFVLFGAGMVALSAFGQKLKESQVPAAAKAAFAKKFPGVKGSWDKEGANYEVNFKQGVAPMSALMDDNGTIVEIETSIHVSDLPKAVHNYMKKHYAGTKIQEAAKIVRSNGEVNYEAEINHKDVIFDANGKFIREAKD